MARWNRRRVHLAVVRDDEIHTAYQLQNEDDSPVGCGLFVDRDWAAAYAHGCGWQLAGEPVTVV
jgi:hypothetical protein